MKKHLKVEKGDSIDNAIAIDAQNSILGVIEENKHIDRICGTKDNGVKSAILL